MMQSELLTRPRLSATTIFCAVLCAVSLGARQVRANMVIRTSPKQQNWIADGVTEYRMDVVADSTEPDVSSEQIFSSEWDVVVPEGLSVTRAEFPDANDFYGPWHPDNMDWNIIDDTLDGNRELTGNNRATNDFTGPQNTEGVLAIYFFSVDAGAIPETTSFDTNEVRFLGNPDFFKTFQPLPWTNEGHNHPFNIVAPPTFDMIAAIIDTSSGLPVTEVRADGTQYKTLIILDTTSDPVFSINGIGWDAGFPEDHFVFDVAETPTQDDFFEGYPTNDTLAQVVTGGELVGNARTTVDQGQGPSNKAGSLEEILFTVRFDVPWTSGSMSANEVEITDTDGNTFTSPDLGGDNIAIQSQAYTIVGPDTEVTISTELPETLLVADGTTEYEMVVGADTTTFPGQHFNLSGWDVVVPSYLTIASAELPTEGDFYAGYPTNDTLAQEVTGGELAGNLRETQNPADGPGSVEGALETIHFTVNTGAPPGVDSFDLNDVRFRDTGMNDYRSPDSGTGVVIQNASFTVVPYVLPDVNHDGYVNIEDFLGFPDCMTGPDVPPTGECTDYDFDADGDVDGMDLLAFQACFTGDTIVSDPACAG